MKRKIAILGSTGSIGVQTLDVVEQHRDIFEVELLTANNNVELLAAQAVKFKPNSVVICNDGHYGALSALLKDEDVKVFAGADSVVELVRILNVDIVVAAMVGFSGLRPAMEAIRSGKAVALANKETLVAAGALVTKAAKENNVPILPVDSEHSAIFQSLQGEKAAVEKLILTASGGPFRDAGKDEIYNAAREQAMKHPNWNMGAKVTIDSASMMNKGLEMIEASWLFGMPAEQIEIVVHPQSIIHSMVQFSDGSVKAQMGMPDMRVPIQYALSYPYRLDLNTPRVDFPKIGELTFQAPDMERFPALSLAFEAHRAGGNMACIMNGANEAAVNAFLNGRILFGKIPEIIEKCMGKCSFLKNPSLEDIFQTHLQAVRIAQDFCR